MKDEGDQHNYCKDMVRADDRARYETTLFAPQRLRPALWTLYAFNQEIAKTRENISEPMLGEIRLQWWRDVIQELKNGACRQHPVVEAAGQWLNNPRTLALLEEIIDARAMDIYDDGPADFDALKQYAHSVGGALSEAALRLSVTSDEIGKDTLQAARACGSAWAMLGLVRAVPFHWASNRTFVPGDDGKAALAAMNAEQMYLLAAPSISEMIIFTHGEVARTKRLMPKRLGDMRHVFSLSSLSSLYLHQLQKAGDNPFRYNEPSDLRRLWALLTRA